MLLPDHEIERLCLENGMIFPFEPMKKRKGVISYGLSHAGYDIRCDYTMKLCRKERGTQEHLDVKNFDADKFRSLPLWEENGPADELHTYFVIPPHGFALTQSFEYVKMPRDVLAICLGKSTYARASLVVNTTPIEPGWEGHITLELSNTSDVPLRVYAGEGLAQLLFYRLASPCRVSYAEKNGKYQGQTEITLPRL